MSHQNYNLLLVLLSYAISVLGSYTALQLAVAIPQARDARERTAAVLAAGAGMGVGAIWAMHFIAMLSCDMGVPVTYEPVRTVASAVLALGACASGLAIAGAGTFNWLRLTTAGTCMGLGVAGMHYLGMSAILMPAYASYDMGLVAASVVIAVIASIAALWLAFNMRGAWQMVGSALVMGVAVCGMHYTGMAALQVEPNGGELPAGFQDGLRGANLGMGIFGVSLALLIGVLALQHMRQRRRAALSI